jgi:regulator of protease activity HflC (stomatin/prohibitin superfamily)
MTQPSRDTENPFFPVGGWPVFALWVLLFAAAFPAAIYTEGVALVGFIPVLVLLLCGFFVVSPNVARVLVLFGRCRGTVRSEGFYWTNPFTLRKRMSLKAHNLNGEKVKVNDLLGNPIEIAAVVVWQVSDSACASFDVEDYVEFVHVQSEAAVRQLASAHPYDEGHTEVVATSLRGSSDEVSAELQRMLQQRLERAGIEVIEARISHLAYAPAIASAMLQRQQATAIIAARAMIVEGAVGMVQMALEQLSRTAVVELDEERKAAMVSNLLVVLCSDRATQPIVNTGSLYT